MPSYAIKKRTSSAVRPTHVTAMMDRPRQTIVSRSLAHQYGQHKITHVWCLRARPQARVSTTCFCMCFVLYLYKRVREQASVCECVCARTCVCVRVCAQHVLHACCFCQASESSEPSSILSMSMKNLATGCISGATPPPPP
jgi:hypothetical protein